MSAPGDYIFLHPEKGTVLGLLWFLLLDPDLSHYDFVETNITPTPRPGFLERLFMTGTIIVLKVALSLTGLKDRFVSAIEHGMNCLDLNRGLLRLIWRGVSGSFVSPRPDDAAYRSITSYINGPVKVPKLIKHARLDDPEVGLMDHSIVELAAYASALAYENAAAIQKVVDKQWQMSFVDFFSCKDSTEAFVFCDKATDANLIVLAFRGTQQGRDFVTDINFSWLNTTKAMGSVHVGFLLALGPVPGYTNGDFSTWFPADYTGTEILAYYTIRTSIVALAKEHANAKIVITGHSLGGALAVMFPALLSYHAETDQELADILDRVEYVKTFGQPRVGDQVFADYMEKVLGDNYRRMAYRFDLVPRIPFDLPVLMKFKHFGTCLQYKGWFKGELVQVMKNKNYFNPLYLPLIYIDYLWDFVLTIWWGLTRWEWEGLTGTLYRIVCILLPGIIFHSGSNYTRSSGRAKVSPKKIID